MERDEFILQIRKADFDCGFFKQLVLSSTFSRRVAIEELAKNGDIMVYYHCFYVLSAATEQSPSLFYEYWDKIAPLLLHPNSYHRNFGLTLIANLTSVDREDRLSTIWATYISRLQDEKLMTAQCCLKNLRTIAQVRPDLVANIVQNVLAIERVSHFTVKQTELLKSDVVDLLVDVYDHSDDKDAIRRFIFSASESVSPKTKAKANQVLKTNPWFNN